MVFSYLQNKESVTELFAHVASKTAERPGGYTRIIKLADVRLGDSAEMCLIELVDFNLIYTKDAPVKKAKTRRSRKSTKNEGGEEATDQTIEANEPKAEAKPKKTAKKTTKKTATKKSSKK
jgi:large subunit ribosomal protein L17